MRQRQLIIETLKGLGYDPKRLPKEKPGKTGLKKEVRELLDGKAPFEAPTSFDTAWKFLRSNGDILQSG